MKRKLIPCLLATILWSPAGVAAEDTGPSMFSFGGFGTLGVVHSSERNADFTASPASPNGAGFTRSWSPALDSLIAAQVTAKLTPQLEAILQVISQQNYDNTYTPHIEWAYIRYQFTPDFSVRVGRTGLPNFLVTDPRSIGYSNHWVRPPVELYSLISVTRNDGVDVTYRMLWGEASNTVQATIGQANFKFPGYNGSSSEHARSRKQLAFVDSFERGFLTLRVNYGQAHVTIPELAPLFDGFRQFGPDGVGIADRYDVNDRVVTFLGMSASYEPGDWFVMGEWGRVNGHSMLGRKTGWYTSGGHRFGQFTPYVNYAQLKANSKTSDPGLNLSGLPLPLAMAAGQLNGALNGILQATPSQKTVSVGARWDFMQRMDLKLQFDHTRLGAGSPGTLSNVQPGFMPGGSLNIISATFDFVF